jgi:hypothetical protein
VTMARQVLDAEERALDDNALVACFGGEVVR